MMFEYRTGLERRAPGTSCRPGLHRWGLEAARRSILTVTTALFICAVGSPAFAQLDAAKSAAEQAVSEGAASQKRIDKIDDEIDSLLVKYRVALRELTDLKDYNQLLGEQIEAQEEEKVSLTEQIGRVQRIERDVFPLMFRMIDAIEQFVSLDLPFLPEERADRIATLKGLMAAADISAAEKFRKILEAYEIEAEYGRTIGAYEGTLEDGRLVDFLQVGRIALVYQTRDGSETAVWDRDAGAWQRLRGQYPDYVRAGIRIAKNQITPDLVIMPVKAPIEASGASQ